MLETVGDLWMAEHVNSLLSVGARNGSIPMYGRTYKSEVWVLETVGYLCMAEYVISLRCVC